MKKFIVILIMALASFVCKAQYNNQYIRQENATPTQWNEWKGLMSQYNKGKAITYGGLTIGVIGMGTCFLLAENAKPLYNPSNGNEITAEDMKGYYTLGVYAFGIGGAVAMIVGQLKKNDARHKLDRFYFNNGFVYTF